MYGDAHLEIGTTVLQMNSLTGVTFNLASVSNALMMALRLRKQNLTIIASTVILATINFVPLIAWIGYAGSIYLKVWP